MTDSSNSQTENSVSQKILAGLLALFVVAKIILLIAAPQPRTFASDLTIDNILQAVNNQRQQRNVVTLNTDSRLSSAAQSKADDMQARHYFAHVDPDGNYIWPKIVAAGYSPYLQLGENLAIEFYDTDSLVSAWMNSPTHRANILNDGFRDQGMGLNFGNANAGQYHSVIANTFGTLLAASKATAPAAAPTAPVAQPSVSGATEPAPIPAPAPAPKPKTTKPQAKQPAATPTPSPAAPATATPVTEPTPEQTVLNPISPRGGYAMATNPASPALAPQSTASPSPQTTTPIPTQTTAPAVVNPAANSPLQGYQINRYFTLAFGIVLLLFLLTDLRKLIEKKSQLVGKKVNNIVLLFLALVVIAVMYWL